MTEDILISIKGLHTNDTEEEEEIEVTSAGKYYLKNGKHYIRYEDIDGATGENIRNLVKIGKNSVEIQKKGSMNTRMLFECGKKNTSWYGTPYGNMLAGIEVTSMRIEEQENQIEADIEYRLEMNYEHVADSRVLIRILAKNSGLFHIL